MPTPDLLVFKFLVHLFPNSASGLLRFELNSQQDIMNMFQASTQSWTFQTWLGRFHMLVL